MRRRSGVLSKRAWLESVKPLMEAPDTPPLAPKDTDVQFSHLYPQHKRLALEHGVQAVVRALGKGIEDPVAIEEWIRQQRLERLELMMKREPMK